MSDVRGVGLDLCEISRMEKMLEKPSFMKKVLTEKEQEYIASRGRMAAESLAAMWAAKEACLKA
ncbi:MAG: 4'-phosphopantetheinyl transferase superfamily protein, partial [Clostridia bacterium]|nr:4'-phosphopantetheinyl transferase superfamily protein [Clostridia bacterium]